MTRDVYVITWRYHDGSGSGFVRAFIDKDMADIAMDLLMVYGDPNRKFSVNKQAFSDDKGERKMTIRITIKNDESEGSNRDIEVEYCDPTNPELKRSMAGPHTIPPGEQFEFWLHRSQAVTVREVTQ